MDRVARSLVVAAALLFAPLSHAALITYSATLSGGAEAPTNASPGTGTARVTLDDVALTLRVQTTFSGLLGNTTVAHIHCCTATALTGTAGVTTQTPSFTGFPTGVTAGSYDQTFDLALASSFNPAYVTANGGTVASARAAFLLGLGSGRAYLNIHSSQFPGGEIRGFLVPEPATLGLAALAFGALVATRRRRR